MRNSLEAEGISLSATRESAALTIPDIRARKGGEPIVCTTAYTTPMAEIADKHCDLILVGDSVGLHPVWLMFALFAFGAMFGFTGLLIAVPAAAAIGVLVRFALEKYLDSDLYVGHSETGAKMPDNDE